MIAELAKNSETSEDMPLTLREYLRLLGGVAAIGIASAVWIGAADEPAHDVVTVEWNTGYNMAV